MPLILNLIISELLRSFFIFFIAAAKDDGIFCLVRERQLGAINIVHDPNLIFGQLLKKVYYLVSALYRG